jgi:peptide/nickel transport system permease protein
LCALIWGEGVMAADGAAAEISRTSPGKRFRRGLSLVTAQRVAVVGLFLVLFWVFVAVLAPLLTAYDPLVEDMNAVNQGPSAAHFLGTDNKGRDLWSRMAYGSRVILVLAPISVLLSMIIGSTLGLISGYFGGRTDEITMRVTDALMAFPTILLYMIVIVAIGSSAINVVIAITIAGIPGVARLVRSLTLDVRTREYVAAAKSRGESSWYIMFVEILPNASGPLLIDGTLRVGYAIFAIGTLGFLGLGLQPPTPDWGSMVSLGRRYITVNPWAVIWPALAISSLVVGLNLIVDGVKSELNRYS